MEKREVKEKRNERKKKKGFTLVELVIVIVTIGVLSGIAVVAFKQVSEAAARATFKANHRTIVSAVNAIYANNDGKPVENMQDAVSSYLRNAEDESKGGLSALQGNPVGAVYEVDDDTGKVKSTLAGAGTGDADTGGADLVYSYDPDN